MQSKHLELEILVHETAQDKVVDFIGLHSLEAGIRFHENLQGSAFGNLGANISDAGAQVAV